MAKVLIFTGAPESKSLDWSSSGLLHHFSEPVTSFTGLATRSRSRPDPPGASSSLDHAIWRSIPLQKSYISTGFSQQHDLQFVDHFPSSANFFTTAAVSFNTSFGSEKDIEIADHLLSQFCEHSLAIHDEIPSSQLALSSTGASQDTSFLSTEASFHSSGDGSPGSVRQPLAHHGGDHLSDLEDIPSAGYLTSIEPATITANLIVGIISIAAPRTVKTRWGSTKSLVEVLVGDETKSGFAVTFWLSSDTINKSELAGLRPQDVVLIQNVALHVFMKKVYGSSLRKGLTKVHLLHRKELDATDSSGHYTSADLISSKSGHPQLEKTKKVRDWVLKFVGTGTATAGAALKGRFWDRPPPDDTQ